VTVRHPEAVLKDKTRMLAVKARFFRGFADPTRLAILESLLDGEKNVNQIVDLLGISQPNASAHLACLRECGLVKSEGRGKFTFYSLYDDKVRDLLSVAEEILAEVGETLYSCTRYRQLVRPGLTRGRSSRGEAKLTPLEITIRK
jgi:DNA-binding transcriptional ArsR family regulator